MTEAQHRQNEAHGGPLADARLEEVKKRLRLIAHGSWVSLGLEWLARSAQMAYEETVALEVGLAACVDGGSYDMVCEERDRLLDAGKMELFGDDGWCKVGQGTPLHVDLETKRDGEDGTNVCWARCMTFGGDMEWIEKKSGVTTITHHSFAAPTHWRWLDDQVTEGNGS